MDLRSESMRDVGQLSNASPITMNPAPTEENPFPAPTFNCQINPECHLAESYSFFGDCSKIILVMVGLPARGKTFISRKIGRYLSWLGYNVKSFNIGQYRRRLNKETVGQTSANFFDPANEDAVNIRNQLALLALDDLYQYLQDGGEVAILDGTNSTRARRDLIRGFFEEREDPENYKIVYIESICNDESIIENNILSCKVSNPDYRFVDPEVAVADFRARIEMYKTVYSQVEEEEGAFIKLINAGRSVFGHDVSGYLPGRILYFLMQLNLSSKSIFFTRHGESRYNDEGRIGGDAPLSEEGEGYALKLAEFIYLQPESRDMKVFCSTLTRTIQTCEHLASTYNLPVMKWRALSEIEVGVMDGLTMDEFKNQYPEEYNTRKENKLTYRYPQGESYRDIIQRLEPVIFELERTNKPILVVGHRAVLRCLYSYFVDVPEEDIPWLPISLHTVYKVTPKAYDTEVQTFLFGQVASEQRESKLHCKDITLPHVRQV